MSERADTATNECIEVDTAARQSSAWAALCAPWLALWSPSRAAAIMIRSSMPAVAVSFALHAAILAFTVTGMTIWSEALEVTSVDMTAEGRLILETGSMEQVWHKWHRDVLIGPAEQISFGVMLGALALACICAWTHLASVHKSGSIRRSFYRAFCSVAACIVVLLFALVAVGTVIVLSNAGTRMPALLPGTSVSFGICVVLWRVGRAVRGVPDDRPDPAIGPRCERCGYDLTYVGQDNRCPECGIDAGESLEPGRARPGCVWEERGGFESWAVTSAAVLFDPTRFYSRLRLRTAERRARAFAAWHFFSIAAAVASWACITLTIAAGGPPDVDELILVPCLIMSAVSCLAWGVRRLAAAIGAGWLLYRRELADFRWIRRVIEYEMAYVWVFCVFNGLLITAAAVMPGLAQVIIRQRAFFWLPLGPAVVIFGNLGLGLIWIWRYRLASRAIRWSNF